MGRDLIERWVSNVVRIDLRINDKWETGGTGVLIDDNGTIFTCKHVVEPEGVKVDGIQVVKGKTSFVDAEVINSDDYHDAAILRVKKDLFFNASINFGAYDDVNLGDGCIILGFPLAIEHVTLSKGTISAKGRGLIKEFQFDTIQIDARVNKGNSGGPVFSEEGKLIGIVSMKYIPFMQEINELRMFAEQQTLVPRSNQGITMSAGMMGVNWGSVLKHVNDAVIRVSKALDKVQVGIGWVIPIKYFTDIMK